MESTKIPGIDPELEKRLLPENLILLGYRGSIAHGMYVGNKTDKGIDDKDLMGVFINPIEHYYGFGRKEDKVALIDEWDAESHELRKFVGLLLKCNPNVISLLWLEPELYLYQNHFGRQLLKIREEFLSRKAAASFTGYAKSQLSRMERLDPETLALMEHLEIILTEAGLDPCNIVADQSVRDNLQAVITQYSALRKKYYGGGYMGNKRRAMVKQFGFDCKNAAHLIRLLRMEVELLRDGRVNVMRKDAEELLQIKTGLWSLERIKQHAEDLLLEVDAVLPNSPLPEEPNRDKVERWLVDILRAYHMFEIRGT